MSLKAFAFILLIILLGTLLLEDQVINGKVDLTIKTLDTSLKTQKTLYGTNGDALEYTYQQVGKTCYEDVRNGQVIESHCH